MYTIDKQTTYLFIRQGVGSSVITDVGAPIMLTYMYTIDKQTTYPFIGQGVGSSVITDVRGYRNGLIAGGTHHVNVQRPSTKRLHQVLLGRRPRDEGFW